MKRQHRLFVTAPFRASALCFEVEGLELLNARTCSDDPLKAHSFHRFRRWAGMRFEAPLEEGRGVEVDLEGVASADGAILVPHDRIRWIPAPEPQLLQEGSKPVDEVLTALCRESEGAARDRVKELGREYFSLLDRRTNPEFTPLDDNLAKTIADLCELLKQRVLLRAQASQCQGKAGPLPISDVGIVRQLSALILGTLEETFGEPLGDPERLLMIGKTHDAFAWGGLFLRPGPEDRVRVPNTAPDGAAIFMFPEFAFLACELGVDVQLWCRLIPILTRMPALYLKVHELHDAAKLPRSFDEYGFPPDVEITQCELQELAQALAATYDSLSSDALGEELGRLAGKAFRMRPMVE